MKFRTFYIYSILNISNGKRYIGCTTNKDKRKTEHFSKLRNDNHQNPRLQEDFNLFGEDSFRFTVLTSFTDSPEYAKDVENKFIESYRTISGVYNKNEAQVVYEKDLGGEKNPMFNKKHSEESKLKMSETRKRLGSARGTNNSHSKLSLDDYLLIKERIFEDTGESYEKKYRRLSEEFSISTVTLKRIKLGNHYFEKYLSTKLKDRYKTFCIDFDDTITQNTKFPNLGDLKPHAVRVINRIKDNGGEICIWTCRTGEHEVKVKDFLKEVGVPYDTFNEILPSERILWGEGGRKVYADVYIDDHEIHARMNGGVDWLKIEEFLFKEVAEKCNFCDGTGVTFRGVEPHNCTFCGGRGEI